jgi:ubiquinone/menaquinone biosynthesis C-methylase UbiE
MLSAIQYQILKRFPASTANCSGSAYRGKSKILSLLGTSLPSEICGKTVIDVGCGEGGDDIEMIHMGASRVIGIDIREEVLSVARSRAGSLNCLFAKSTDEQADVVVSIDAFEHFAEPERILETMQELLRPNGTVLISFGPTWYHPLGGHLFSVFPWAHLLFTEKALMRWRSNFKSDGATRFSEVAGGLNQMTIARFEKIVERSGLSISRFELVPIRQLRRVHSRITREFTTAIVRCKLIN